MTKLVLHACDAKEEAENARVTNKGDIPREHFQKGPSRPVGTGPQKASILGMTLHLQNHLMTRLSSTVHQETECTTALETQLRKCHSIFTMILNPIEVVPWA